MKEEISDELIEIAYRGWPLNTGPLHTYVCVCSIKGQGLKVCELAILIIMFGGFSVFSNFYCGFSVFT